MRAWAAVAMVMALGSPAHADLVVERYEVSNPVRAGYVGKDDGAVRYPACDESVAYAWPDKLIVSDSAAGAGHVDGSRWISKSTRDVVYLLKPEEPSREVSIMFERRNSKIAFMLVIVREQGEARCGIGWTATLRRLP
jgi:hypothetical protein